MSFIFIIIFLYIFSIVYFFIPAGNDILNTPVVENNGYTLSILKESGENEIVIFLTFETNSPSFWTEEPIYVNVILEAHPSISLSNRSHDFKVSFPYSSFAFPKDDGIYYESVPEPYIELEKADEPDLYYEGKTIIAYHFRGYFNVIVEERDYNQTLIDSVILEDVIEISSHTDRMSYNSTRIQLAFSIILFIISIILFYNQIPEIKKRLFNNDTEESGNGVTEKNPVNKKNPNEKKEDEDQVKNYDKKE